MNFSRGRSREEPEINLIPMIDVLLVIIIFLMLTTTYSRFAGLEINLPTADAQASNDKPVEINVAVTASGEVVINKRPVSGGEHSGHCCRTPGCCAAGRQGSGGDHQCRRQGHAPAGHRRDAGRPAGWPHSYLLRHPGGSALVFSLIHAT